MQLILRTTLVLHVSGVLVQSVFAGQFLAGADRDVAFHERTAWVLLAICAVQIITAFLASRAGLATLWLVLGSVFVFLAEGLQMGTGYGRFLSVHIPLGVIVFGAVTWQAISVFRAPLAAGAPAR